MTGTVTAAAKGIGSVTGTVPPAGGIFGAELWKKPVGLLWKVVDSVKPAVSSFHPFPERFRDVSGFYSALFT